MPLPEMKQRSRTVPAGSGLLLVLGLLLSAMSLMAQNSNWPSAPEVLDNLRSRFNRIHDYQVDLQVSLDMPMLRMPRKRMTFSFKQPDKSRLEAKGFAMVPRRGLVLSPDSLFKQMRNLATAGDTLLDGHRCLILKGQETGPDDLVLQAEVIVDQNLWLVRSMTTGTGDEDMLRLHIEYIEVAPDMWMPRKTHLRFELSERFLRTRRSRGNHFDPDMPTLPSTDVESMVGEATITFTHYRVNVGIPDDFFDAVKAPLD